MFYFLGLDFYEENQKLKKEIEYLNNVISNNITEIMIILQDHSGQLDNLNVEMVKYNFSNF